MRAADGIGPAGVDVATVPTAAYHPKSPGSSLCSLSSLQAQALSQQTLPWAAWPALSGASGPGQTDAFLPPS